MRFGLLLLLIAAASLLSAAEFERDIEPIFNERCLDCHGPDKQKGQLRVDRRADLLRGGDSGEAAVVPGKPEQSFLLRLVEHKEAELEMPAKGKPLTSKQIKLIRDWIAAGAKTPERYGPDTQKTELKHWAFKPVVRPKTEGIDALLETRLNKAGLAMSPAADRRTLLRRLHVVMTGLAPSPQAVEAFVGDPRPDAWERAVESVLASPHYGERWAAHWLDLVRFGETNGYETNRERPTAWPYRDWVIAAFNDDKPYNQFVREQIAGDALGEPVGTGFLVAGPVDIVKGKDPKLNRTQRMNELDDMINTTGTAFLGLTTGCARCHNHKFDPISHKDYYAMQAIFAGVKHGDSTLPISEKKKQRLAALDAEIAELSRSLQAFVPKGGRPPVKATRNVELFAARQAKFVRFTIEATNRSEPCIDELLIFSGTNRTNNVALASRGAKATSNGDFVHALHKLPHINDGAFGNPKSWISKHRNGGWVQIELPEPRSIQRIEWGRDREGKFNDRLALKYRIESAVEPGKWQPVTSSADRRPRGKTDDPVYDFSKTSPTEAEQGRAWLARRAAARKEKTAINQTQKVWTGTFAQPGPTHRLYRGEIDMPRERVGPDAIEVFTSLELAVDAPERERRLALANWIANEKNPLSARVIANRIWQFHFGTGIVDTPSDLGRNGTAPSHPELLDWLATELVENGWSLKHLHRLVLRSDAWRQNNAPRAEALRVDAATRLLWRFPPRRMEAEGIRDAMLAASGELRLEPRGGPGFSPFEVQMENVRHYFAKKKYGPEDWRRMIYMTKVRQEREHVFGAFDCPDSSMVVPKRSRSTTPLQALNLLNSDFVMQQAALFAERLETEADDDARVQRAWSICFQRPPDATEVAESLAFIEAEGLVQFARALFNTNEFVFIP